MILRYLKWPDYLHYEVEVVELGQDRDGLWLLIEQGSALDHGPKGAFAVRAPQIVVVPGQEMWTARWFRRADRGRGGRVDNYACYIDITTVAVQREDVVELVDLDLDVVQTWDGEVLLLDEDEFLENKSGYPSDLAAAAVDAADDVLKQLQQGTPPFDGRHRLRW